MSLIPNGFLRRQASPRVTSQRRSCSSCRQHTTARFQPWHAVISDRLCGVVHDVGADGGRRCRDGPSSAFAGLSATARGPERAAEGRAFTSAGMIVGLVAATSTVRVETCAGLQARPIALGDHCATNLRNRRKPQGSTVRLVDCSQAGARGSTRVLARGRRQRDASHQGRCKGSLRHH